MANILSKTKVVDLFCGIGGMTHGFEKEGFSVVAGVDNDEKCQFGYEENNQAKFIHSDINNFKASSLNSLLDNSKVRVLIGCAPCQPYSNYRKNRKIEEKTPLERFGKLINESKPDIVSMENVRGLANKRKYPEFRNFLKILEKNKYNVFYKVINASDYGVPQNRHRLVLLASKLGSIELIKPTHKDKKITVRDTIEGLEPIGAGETAKKDPLHKSSNLSSLNMKRIKATPKDGGNSQAWDEDLLPDCYKKETGQTYKNTVYGRMRWDEPSPTITTQCTGLGNGRFGHPEQNRAMSLREAALLQTFPKSYKFFPKNEILLTHTRRFIGNAVPPKLGRVIAQSIKKHIEKYAR